MKKNRTHDGSPRTPSSTSSSLSSASSSSSRRPRKVYIDSYEFSDVDEQDLHNINNNNNKMATCRMLPHGNYSLIPAILCTMAWLASLFQDGCDYSRLTGEVVQDLASNPDVPWLEVGFGAYREPYLNTQNGHWEVVYTGSCYAYPDSVEQDSYWMAAISFDFLALVLGGGSTFFLWFSSCCIFSPGTWRWAGYQVLLAAMFQTLAFLWFNTSMCQSGTNNCELFWGSKSDIVSATLWTVSALSIFCYYPVPKDYQGGEGVFLESVGGATTSAPTVQMVENTSGSSNGPTVTTAATAAGIPVGTDEDDYDDQAVVTPAGQSSRQGEQPRNYDTKEMRDVELT